MAPEPIVLRKAAERTPAPSQTPGMKREEAFSSQQMWTGHVTTAPKSPSGWHHHGDNESYVFVLEGELQFEFGPAGKDVVVARPGDFVKVPKNTIHRENNPGTTPGRCIVFRFGSGPPNFNVEGPAMKP